ncbi:MAG: diguanylate cyclase, partial [Stackebrandtia sp.]
APADTESPIPLVLSVEEGSVRGFYVVLIALVVAAGVLAVGAATWMARSTTRPLAELAAGADAVAKGDLNVRVPVRGHDELASLAGAFNRMARETQGYVSALTASRDQLRGQLTVLGDTLSSTLDLDRILEVIVDTAMAATGAQAGVMLLVDPEDPDALIGHVGDGLVHRGVEPSTLRVRLGDGLLGRVAAEGRPRRGRLDAVDEFAAGEPSCSTFIAVPVTGVPEESDEDGDPAAGGVLLGVLAVYDRHGGDDFDDSDLSTLRTFAGQAAVAVGNVLTHREAQRLSLTDPLTGLWNYRYLQVSLSREVERAGRFHRGAAVIVIDIDKFKIVNDTYGHPAGDTVLTELAGRISAVIREVDLAFRYGGEEFVVLLPEADAAGATRVAQRLLEVVRSTPVTIPAADETAQPVSLTVTVSLGVAVFPLHGGDGPAVLAAADEALYAAKADGRDTWRVAES